MSAAAHVIELSEQRLSLCFQCAVCSGTCPFAEKMDTKPHEVIRMLQAGLDEVLELNAPWVCTVCLDCTARCPRGINIAAVMDALRAIKLARGESGIVFSSVRGAEAPEVALVACMRRSVP